MTVIDRNLVVEDDIEEGTVHAQCAIVIDEVLVCGTYS